MSVLEKMKAIARSSSAAAASRKTAPSGPARLRDAPLGQKPISVFASVNGYAQAEIVVGADRPAHRPL